MTVLVDSWAWIEYFKGTKHGSKAKEIIDSNEHIIISVINIAEVFKYFLSEKNEKEANIILGYILKRSFVIPLFTEISIEAAKLRYKKKWGLGDAIIYATAIHNNAKLLSGDSDFKNENNVIFIG